MKTIAGRTILDRVIAMVLSMVMMISVLSSGTVGILADEVDGYYFHVMDMEAQPLGDVEIKVNDVKMAVTDSKGEAVIKGLTPDTEFQYEMSKKGYKILRGSFVSQEPWLTEVCLEQIEKTTAYGTVRDIEGAALEGALIRVSGYGSYEAKTNVSGEFSIPEVYVGQEYRLDISLKGYETYSQRMYMDRSNEIVLDQKQSDRLAFSLKSVEMKYGESLKNTAKSASGTADSYESSNTAVVKVDNSGMVYAVGVGTATVKAVRKDADALIPSLAECTVTVKKAEQAPLFWFNTVPDSLRLGDSFENAVFGGSGMGKVTYASSNVKVADVDPDGKLSIKAVGETTITATKAGGDYYEDRSVSYNVVVRKAAQAQLVFIDMHPDALYFGDTYDNRAIGGSVTGGHITYHSSDESVVTVNEKGQVKAQSKAGEAVITATMSGDSFYDEVSASYRISVYGEFDRSGFRFVKGGGTHKINFGDTFSNAAVGTDEMIWYGSSDERVATVDSNGQIMPKSSGRTVIYAYLIDKQGNERTRISYTLEVMKKTQDVTFEKSNKADNTIMSVSYGDVFSNVAIASTEVDYISSDNSVASVDKNGALTIHKAGIVTITAAAKENDQYAPASASYTLRIEKAERKAALSLGETPVTSYQENDNIFVNPIIAPEDELKGVRYEIVAGQDIVQELDQNSGAIKLQGAGSVTMKIIMAETDCYLEKELSYVVTVGKAFQAIRFASSSVDIINGSDYESPRAVEASPFFSDVKIRYYVKDDPEGIVDSVDRMTGELSLSGNEGTAVILASKAEDINYLGATDEYNITVSGWTADDSFYSVTGEPSITDSGWYPGQVSIVSKDGFLLSTDPDLPVERWKHKLDNVVEKDGETEVVFYILDKESGLISAACTEHIKRDSTPPEARIRRIRKSGWRRIFEIITLGLLNRNENYFIAGGDELSGVDKIEYYVDHMHRSSLDREELDGMGEWTEGDSLSVSRGDAGYIYAKVTDLAGNITYASTTGMVYDITAPDAEVRILTQTAEPGYYSDDVEVAVYVKDAAPSSGIRSIDYSVVMNGDTEHPTQYGTLYSGDDGSKKVDSWNSVNNRRNIVVSSEKNQSDNVVVYVIVTDNAGNEAVYQSDVIRLGFMLPSIEVSFGGVEPVGTYNDIQYYDTTLEATITIFGKSVLFSDDLPVITLHSWFGNEETVDRLDNLEWVHTEPTADELSNGEKTLEDAAHTAHIELSEQGRYILTVSYTDKSGRSAPEYRSDLFAIDLYKPEGEVLIETTRWDRLLDRLIFNFWRRSKINFSVNILSDPEMMESVEYYISDGTEAMTWADLDALPKDAWKPYEEGLSVDRNRVFAVYVKLTDVIGRYNYISSNGVILDMEESRMALLVPEPNEYGYYNSDVSITVTAEEIEPRSGLKEVEYWVVSDGVETQREVLYHFDKKNARYEELTNRIQLEFTVKAELNDSDDVKVYLQVTDNAGNKSSVFTVNDGEEPVEHVELRVAAKPPQMELSFDNNSPYTVTTDDDGVSRGYFKQRKAFLAVKERPGTFDQDAVLGGITFTSTDGKGEEILFDEEPVSISFVGSEENVNPNETVHRFEVEFLEDANYTFGISYMNKAGIAGEVVFAQDTVCGEEFTVDSTEPVASISTEKSVWNKLLEVLTFGIWSNDSFSVSAIAEDDTSPVSLEYYLSENPEALDAEGLGLIPDEEWKPFEEMLITEEKLFSIYLRATDYAGNRTYINSDGHVLDKTWALITITPESPNARGIYNKDVSVQIDVKEDEPSAGIKQVQYWLYKDGAELKHEVLFSFEYVRNEGENANGGTLTVHDEGLLVENYTGIVPVRDELRHEYSKSIIVDSKVFNSSDVKVVVQVEDNAGNVSEESLGLDIDITSPTVSLTYDNNQPHRTEGGRGYYPASRTAYLTVRERTNHFDGQLAKEMIRISATDSIGRQILDDTGILLGEWETTEGAMPDDAIHTLPITFSPDANYDWFIGYADDEGDTSVGYCDLAGNSSGEPDVGGSVTPYTFTIDRIEPIGMVWIERLGLWNSLIGRLTFGRWSRSTVNVKGSAGDETSPIAEIAYYKTPDTSAKTRAELAAIDEWMPFDTLSVPANEQFAVYLRITDYAGNVAYISTDGVIVDNIQPNMEQVAPEITIRPTQPVNEIYNTDVSVAVSVMDPLVGDTYSGLRDIRYEVLNMGSVTQSGTLYHFDVSEPTQSQLIPRWSSEEAIIVSCERNNSNDVVIRVYASDNAGNSNEASVQIKIDTTKPTMTVRFDNNDADTSFDGGKAGPFFKAGRTATVVVTERNFDARRVSASITNAYGSVPGISGWSHSSGGGNGDGSTHTATITFSEDGNYNFDITCTDMGGNACETVDYSGSLSPQHFVIDKTAPQIAVSYDNNTVANMNYYNTKRTATVSITERNFETSRLIIDMKASNNGERITPPAISGWTSNGGVNTATIEYENDGFYTFDIAYTDMAGNAAVDFPEQRFHIDTTKPVVSITKIVDESANNDMGNIGFVVTVNDANFDVFKPSLSAVIRIGDLFRTIDLDIGTSSDVEGGKIFTVSNLDSDGVYRFACDVIDKAGNSYSEIILTHEDGSPYKVDKVSGDTLLTFSVNRNGSTYDVDRKTIDLTHKYYVQKVDSDIILSEINVDPLETYQAVLNDKQLREHVDYTVEHTGGDGLWEKYTYTIKKAVFETEGEYNLVVSSRDKAENDAFSDVKDASVHFVVDRTAPKVAVTGLVDEGRYQTDRQIVTLVPTDDGGALRSLVVYRVDGSGNELGTLLNLEGKEFEEALEKGEGKVTFELDEGLYQNVRIVCDDMADYGDEENIIFEETIKNVSVASNPFLIFWVNKPLRGAVFGSLVAVVLVGGVGFGIFKAKKKKVRAR